MADPVDVPDLQPLKTYTAQQAGTAAKGDLQIIANTPPQGAKGQAQYIAKAAATSLILGKLAPPGHCSIESPSGYSGSPLDGSFALNPPTDPAAQGYPRWVVDVDDPSTPGQVIPPDGTVPPPPLPTIGTVNITGGGAFQVGDAITLTAFRSGNASVTWGWTPPAGSLVTPSTTNVQSIPAAAETDTGTWTATATEAEQTSDGPTKSGTEQVTVTVPPPIPTIGTVTVTGGGTYTVGDEVTLTASISGDATDVVWSWAAPAGSGQTPPGDSATWVFTSADNDDGTWTATATSATASDSPQNGTASLTVNPPGGGYDPDAQAWINKIESASGDNQPLTEGMKTAIDNFYLAAKANGYYSKLDVVYCGFGALTLQGSLWNMIDPEQAIGNNGFVADRYDRSYGLNASNGQFITLDVAPAIQNSNHMAYMMTSADSGFTDYRNMGYFGPYNLISLIDDEIVAYCNTPTKVDTGNRRPHAGGYPFVAIGSRLEEAQQYMLGPEDSAPVLYVLPSSGNPPRLIYVGRYDNSDTSKPHKFTWASIGAGLELDEMVSYREDIIAFRDAALSS